jgi:ABC-type transport system substrate-binding protein
VDIAGGYAQPVRQFVSSGVFGFNPEIEGYVFDMKKALATAEPVTSQSFEQLLVTLDYAVGNDVVAQYIQDQFRQIGIDVLLNPLSGQEFQEKLESGSSEFYYLGWRSELGDANDFLQNVAHSRDQDGLSGQYNGTGYLNPEADELIDSSLHDLNVKTRLKSMQDAMKILVEDDIAGIPLFETQTIFAYNNKLQFEPRVDGYIYAAEIR